ncbi:SMI1/KNR4 family protein [Fredinandcohnia sp. 179-A 10B2 NHS]|uniref:SMI1/KNR4 family protein n=1 Tax=Fredinandcohnia sp. 179-A 10B2 NHS TaxID=3235176 RepID=UPI0039A3D456
MQSNVLLDSAKNLIERSNFKTRVATKDEITLLKKELGENLPDWLIQLMTSFPICSSQLFIPYTVEGDDEEYELLIDLLDPEEMIVENKHAIPGCAVFDRGYLCIGVESRIGDSYAINIYEGNNPPVYLLNHEYGEETEKIINNKELVIEQLSDLFSLATLRNHREEGSY